MHIFIICTNTISDANRCVTPRGISYQDLKARVYVQGLGAAFRFRV